MNDEKKDVYALSLLRYFREIYFNPDLERIEKEKVGNILKQY